VKPNSQAQARSWPLNYNGNTRGLQGETVPLVIPLYSPCILIACRWLLVRLPAVCYCSLTVPPQLVVRRPGVFPPPPLRLPSKRWRDLILRVWHVDPLRCPVCQNPMRVLGVIDDPRAVEKMLLNCRVDTRKAARQDGPKSVRNQRDREKAILPHPRSVQYIRARKNQFPAISPRKLSAGAPLSPGGSLCCKSPRQWRQLWNQNRRLF
jgi:hypothetical protein